MPDPDDPHPPLEPPPPEKAPGETPVEIPPPDPGDMPDDGRPVAAAFHPARQE